MLTTKQERFCIEVLKQPNYSDAYRLAYDTKKWTDKSVNEKASQMMADVKILSRVEELRKQSINKEISELQITLLSQLNRLDSIIDSAEKESDKINAIKEQNKLLALYKEHNQQKNFPLTNITITEV